MAAKVSDRVLTALQFGTCFLGASGGYFYRIAPPEDTLRFWPGLAAILAAFAYIVAFLRRERRVQVRLFSLFLMVSLPLVLLYYWEYQSRTAPYAGGRVVCGTELTQKAREDMSSNQRTTREQLLSDFRGHAVEVWTEDSIIKSRLVLGALYSMTVGLLALSFLSGIQSIKQPTDNRIGDGRDVF